MVINCYQIARKVFNELRLKVDRLNSEGQFPKLATILVGDNYASKLYVERKLKYCTQLGIYSSHFHFAQNTHPTIISEQIQLLNEDKSTHGILLQLPVLYKGHSVNSLVNTISPQKDVDGLNYQNLGANYQGLIQSLSLFESCSVLAFQKILDECDYKVEGKTCCIVNDGILVGKPIAAYILKNKGTPVICNKYTKNLIDLLRSSDIIVTAVGDRTNFVLREDMVKTGSFVVDFGITYMLNKIWGDVDIDSVAQRAGFVTKVPGVGTLTVAMLMQNTVYACSLCKG